MRHFHPARVVLVGLAFLAGGCAQLPTAGPGSKEIESSATRPGQAAIQLIEINTASAARLARIDAPRPFSESLGSEALPDGLIGAGDTIEVSLWEAPPATLFGSAADPRTGLSGARPTTLPEQLVDREGFVSVPFAGRVRAIGRRPVEVANDIVSRLRGKANQPEALVRVTRSASASVTVVGEVGNSLRFQITPTGERLLDALAAAGGVKQPVNKVTLQVTRGASYNSMPLEMVIRDPRQNVPLRPGDVITAIYQPFSFTALGATGKNEEFPLESQGITLAQALARAGGLVDNRSSAQGLFLFRLERPDAMEWPSRPVATTPEGLVPVVYRLDLRDPVSFFAMQNFPVRNRDVLYVANAPATELQKFLNLVFSAVYPILTTIQVTR